MHKSKTVRVAGVVAALAATGAMVAGGTAATADESKGPVPGNSIKIKGNNHPRFDAPETVNALQDLQVVNKTNPGVIGPHTFSLIEKDQLPRNREQFKRCAKLRGVCKDIFNAHEVDPQTFEVGERNVENGLVGWDARFTGDEPGDSWFTDEEGETTSRQVTATPGNLWFICIIHPDMQGKVKVVGLP
jgi:hypothetical protein